MCERDTNERTNFTIRDNIRTQYIFFKIVCNKQKCDNKWQQEPNCTHIHTHLSEYGNLRAKRSDDNNTIVHLLDDSSEANRQNTQNTEEPSRLCHSVCGERERVCVYVVYFESLTDITLKGTLFTRKTKQTNKKN